LIAWKPLSSTEFQLPDVDAAASTEIGVMLLGLEADRLLAGLGLATLADDPARVTMVVDQTRHGAVAGLTMAALVELGTGRWRAVRPAFAGSTVAPAALRQQWVAAEQAVNRADIGELGPASRAYLAACLLRRVEVDRHVEAGHDVSEVAP
jgi:Family of unknown function (DUF6187)